MRLEVDSAKQAARAACRRFAPESHPFKDKLRAARRLDPDQKNYTCATTLSPSPASLRLQDYAMIGCFFDKKMKQLQSINHRELIKFEDSYKLCHDYFPSPAVDEAFLRQRHFIVRAHFFIFLFFWRMFWRHAPSPGLSEMARKTPRFSTPLLGSRH